MRAQTTQYVDPRVDELLRALVREFKWVRLAAYRSGCKVRALQHFSALSLVRVDELFNCFRAAEVELAELHDPSAMLTPETMSTILLQIYSRVGECQSVHALIVHAVAIAATSLVPGVTTGACHACNVLRVAVSDVGGASLLETSRRSVTNCRPPAITLSRRRISLPGSK
jgi:hypothetical protein